MNRRGFLATAGGAGIACSRDRRPRLNVYNWSDYIDPAMIARFEGERGVRVRYATYEGNDEMLAKAITGNSGWDVVFPTHTRFAPMVRNGLLARIDHRRLPSLGNLDAQFQRPVWDPSLDWCVPYLWNATGIAFNRGQVEEPRGWDTLWSPALRGRLTMLDGDEEVIGACLQKLHLPFGSTDPEQLQAARTEAIRQKPLLRAYINAEVRDQIVAGDVLAAQMWSTTASQAIHANSRIGFDYPGEGYPLWCDCAAVLRETARYELAHEFLEFLLRPDVAAANAKIAESATANGAAQALLPHDPVLYPPDDVYRRGVWPQALPSASQRYRDRLWTEIKAA
jgi:spermidine/putrescine transport system substrate-binding protein